LRLFDRIENAASLPENVQIIVLLAVRKPIIESGHHVALNSRAPEEAAVYEAVYAYPRRSVSMSVRGSMPDTDRGSTAALSGPIVGGRR
jgi:hypothetical protein